MFISEVHCLTFCQEWPNNRKMTGVKRELLGQLLNISDETGSVV